MDLDGTDAFNRMLERVEELVAENGRTQAALNSERHTVVQQEHEIRMLKRQNEDVARLERFVESTPERQEDWRSYITPKPPKEGDDDQPF